MTGIRTLKAVQGPLIAVALSLGAAHAGAASASTAAGQNAAVGSHLAPRSLFSGACHDRTFREAARRNAASIRSLRWAPFGVDEVGWRVYAPRVAVEIGTDCDPHTSGFAEALARWQQGMGLKSDGVFTPETFAVFKGVWQERRPFVMATKAQGAECPTPPAWYLLAALPKEIETFEREDRQTRPEVLAAWRELLEAARAEVPAVRRDPKALTIFSGYRDPIRDFDRCNIDGNCDGARRARCSAHRTGAAVDLNVGWKRGFTADSTATPNRLHQVRTPAYRWMIRNAGRFGFVNYAFEPWHWEYVGPLRTTPERPLGPPTTPAEAEETGQ